MVTTESIKNLLFVAVGLGLIVWALTPFFWRLIAIILGLFLLHLGLRQQGAMHHNWSHVWFSSRRFR